MKSLISYCPIKKWGNILVLSLINKNQARKDFNNDDEKYERLITLSSKVTTDENGYKNISATNEEYEEYISLCNEIAGIYPTVVSSYDA